MATQIQLRHDTAANWQSSDPVLAVGEVGINTDTNALKIGDGVSTWTELEYFTGDNNTFVPLPEFLDYVEGRGHLANLNSNFGWDASGLWFGNAAEGDSDSYPVFTSFTMAQSDAVVVEFNVDWQDECSDIGVCIYLDGDTPRWVWGTDSSRISAQFDCLIPMIKGLTVEVSDEQNQIPNPGMYHIRFTYNPAAADKVTLELFSGTNTNTLISTLVLDEVLGSGAYRVGFAADNNGGTTYISDLSITVNEDTPYTDTLQAGDSGSGSSADIADFVFNFDGDVSSMVIHNHDMEIRTTRDDGQDSDIGIYSADDVWIEANDTLELASIANEVVVRTNDGEHQWIFKGSGNLGLPSGSTEISSGSNGTIITDSRTVTFSADYADATSGLNQGEAVYLPINADTQWFAANTYSTAIITFADATSVQTVAIYDTTSQNNMGMIFQWSGPLNKTAQEVYPLVVTGNITVPKEYVALVAGDAGWRFDMDGAVTLPSMSSNQRTGTGEVLQFGDPVSQSIITGPTPVDDFPTAQRFVVAGQDGLDGTTGEGGDVYLWAGRGGDSGGTGGDVKVDAGNGGGTAGAGGTVKVRGGNSTNAQGGFVEVTGGGSSSEAGGNITIRSGYSDTNSAGSVIIGGGSSNTATGGNVTIEGGGSYSGTGGAVSINTYNNAAITISGSGGEFLNDPNVAGNQIATVSQLPAGATGSFISQDGKAITVTNGIITDITDL